MSRIVAVLLYPGCVFFEIALAAERLAQSFDILYFTPDGTRHKASNGTLIQADGSYSNLVHAEAVCILVPGGNPDSILMPKNVASESLRANAGRGALLAGICAGNLVLASTGLLQGARVTHNYTLEYASPEAVEFTKPFWVGTRYEKSDVVVDANFITAQPWAYQSYASAIVDRLSTLAHSTNPNRNLIVR